MAAEKFWCPIVISRALLLNCCLAASVCMCLSGMPVAASGQPQPEVSVPSVAATELQERLSTLNNVTADFDQRIVDGYGNVLENSQGSLKLSKPSIRWEVVSPFPQIITVDADQVQIYDPDLEQVTQRQLGEDWQQVPLTLLTHDARELTTAFSITSELNSNGVLRYTLTPRASDALVRFVDLMFQADALAGIVITDHVNQQTEILFRNYQAGQVIQSDAFIIELPPGTDIVQG